MNVSITFSLWCRTGYAFGESRFALRQQPKKDKQNVDVVPPGKISADAHELNLIDYRPTDPTTKWLPHRLFC